MPSKMLRCPQCQATLRVATEIKTGDLVECSRCRQQFPVPDLDSVPPPAPLTGQEISESRGAGRRKFADLDDSEGVSESLRRRSISYDDDADYPRGRYDDDLERRGPLTSDYTIDLGRWFQYGTAHFGEVVGPAIGFGLIFFLIVVAIAFIPCIGPIAQILVQPPLQAGLTIVCLAQLKGRPWSFGEFFSGFTWWGSLVGLNFIVSLGVCLTMIPSLFVFIFVLKSVPGPGLQEVAIALTLISLNGIVVAYFAFRLTYFAIPLIIDREYNISEAIEGSWTLTRGHFWSLFGISLLLGIMSIPLITIPLAELIRTAGYLLIAGTRPPLESPSPMAPGED